MPSANKNSSTDLAHFAMVSRGNCWLSVDSPHRSRLLLDRKTAEAYLRFARERFALYSFIMDRVRETHGSAVVKRVWNLLLEAASGISGQPNDTAAAVATWSFLHGTLFLSTPAPSVHLGQKARWSVD